MSIRALNTQLASIVPANITVKCYYFPVTEYSGYYYYSDQTEKLPIFIVKNSDTTFYMYVFNFKSIPGRFVNLVKYNGAQGQQVCVAVGDTSETGDDKLYVYKSEDGGLSWNFVGKYDIISSFQDEPVGKDNLYYKGPYVPYILDWAIKVRRP